MKIIEVIPIAKGVPQEKLSYFTSKEVSLGALVATPVRNKIIPAVVSSIREAKEVKSSIKGSEFSLKPIKSVLSQSFIAPEFLSACKEIAEYYISTVGAVLKDFIPQAIFNLEAQLPSQTWKLSFQVTPNNANGRHEIMILQSPKKDRLQYYKSVIREEFAKNKSVFFCFPTIADADEFGAELQKGIEKYAVILTGKMTDKKIKEEWKKAIEEKHPVLIIATKSFLSLPRQDIGAIIIDQESSSAYKNQKQPYLDVRKSAEMISKHLKTRLVFGDEFLRSETFYRKENGEFLPSPTAHSRILSEVENIIVDAKENSEEKKSSSKKFSSITPRLERLIGEALQNNEKIIIFANRRGYGSTTICSECQKPLLCGQCEAPMVLHKEDSGNGTRQTVYVCHKCLKETLVPEKCPNCKSWRLETFGIGVQMVVEEIKNLFPSAKIFEMDGDSIKNDKQGKEIADAFLAPGGAVLVGTEIIFSHMNRPANHVAIISIDGLFAMPEFKINERVFHLLLRLKSLAQKTFLIQTRRAEQPIFQYISRGNISGFYKEELENRKRFQYPPFKLLIKLTKESKSENQLAAETSALEKILAEWNPSGYKAFIPKIKNLHRRHILLKIDPQTWPPNQSKLVAGQASKQEKLYKILKNLPLSWKKDIDPETLL